MNIIEVIAEEECDKYLLETRKLPLEEWTALMRRAGVQDGDVLGHLSPEVQARVDKEFELLGIARKVREIIHE